LLHYDRWQRHHTVLLAFLLSPHHQSRGLETDVTNPFALPKDTAANAPAGAGAGPGAEAGAGNGGDGAKGGKRGLLGRMRAAVASVAAFSSSSSSANKTPVDDAYVSILLHVVLLFALISIVSFHSC
jgi:hypothetical protein